jgi:hypothetical protein
VVTEPKIDFNTPHSARMWNYWMGGKDNYPVDRAAGDAFIKIYPDVLPLAKQSRQFLIRAVRFLAGEAGIHQFLDIGTGLPTMQNTHEVAQAVNPDSKIVYVDNDPLVLAHARALLVNTTPEGVTNYIDADFENPELIVSDARNVLNFTRPIAVMFMGVLGHVAEQSTVRGIVSTVMAAVPSGSYLVLWDSADTSSEMNKAEGEYEETGAVPYHLRTVDEIRSCFDGLELLEPGFLPFTHWRPDSIEVGTIVASHGYGGVARKP